MARWRSSPSMVTQSTDPVAAYPCARFVAYGWLQEPRMDPSDSGRPTQGGPASGGAPVGIPGVGPQ
jgi:hypothetical protein